MNNYIDDLIKEGEHQKLDFKFEVSDSKKIARSLAAFANTDGGKLLIGVKDNGVISGIRSNEEAYMIETAAHLYTKPEVTFSITNHNVRGKTVVEVDVQPSSTKPHYAPDKNNNWKAYIRVKDENQLANKVIIKVWQRQVQESGIYLKYTDAEKLILSYVEQHGEISFTRASRISKSSRNKTENMLANFIAIGILEPVFEEKNIKYQIRTTGNFTF